MSADADRARHTEELERLRQAFQSADAEARAYIATLERDLALAHALGEQAADQRERADRAEADIERAHADVQAAEVRTRRMSAWRR
ncbi:hypothetical protein [Microtetraspora fusca]|uniref:hypothetical protein n=1 Tax=Microtetraspora fusca TaxID=1997 RepID=UPI0012F7368D|nr:hypothetical protein [Microtetraspora fusca]